MPVIPNFDSRAVTGLEPQQRPYDALDGPVLLLDNAVEVLGLAHFDVWAGVGPNAQYGGGVGGAQVDGDLRRHTVQVDGTFQKT